MFLNADFGAIFCFYFSGNASISWEKAWNLRICLWSLIGKFFDWLRRKNSKFSSRLKEKQWMFSVMWGGGIRNFINLSQYLLICKIRSSPAKKEKIAKKNLKMYQSFADKIMNFFSRIKGIGYFAMNLHIHHSFYILQGKTAKFGDR